MSLALTPEFIELAGTCLSHAVNNRWNEGKAYLQTWQNPTL